MTELLIILLLTLANGVFAGAEIAILATRKTRLQELAVEGNRAAAAALGLREEPERFLATVQVGITVVGSTAAAFGGATLTDGVAGALAAWPLVGEHARPISIALVVAFVSYLSLVLGELVPKSLALHAGERYALLVVRLIVFLAWVTRPVVWLLTVSSNLVLRPFGDRTTFSEARLSTAELQQLVEEATKVGALNSHAGEIASRALDFGDLVVGEVMVPRPRVIMISRSATRDEVEALFVRHGHARLPVFGDGMDDVVGFITAKDFLALRSSEFDLGKILRPAYFVLESTRAVDVLRKMQQRRTHLAVVVDEYGAVAGILTLEDIVEELVGEIFSERDVLEEQIQAEADGVVRVRASTPIRDLNRALSINLSENEDWTTVGGLAMALAGGVPQKGQVLRAPEGVSIEIVDATPRVVRSMRVLRTSRDSTQ